MIFLNSVISLLADLGINLCIAIGLWMVNPKLGATTLGLYAVLIVSNALIQHERNKAMKELFEKSERL